MTYTKTKIYETPLVEVTGVSTESGFAQSGDYSMKGAGSYSDMDKDWNDNGTL